MSIDPRIIAELKKCKADFPYFARKYLKILDANNNKFIPFRPNFAQMKLLSAADKNNWVYVLKARQVGITTGIAAINFWKALFTPNYKIAVVAHTSQSAKNIFEIYASYYNNLPDFLKVETTAANVNEIKFITGSQIKVGSATSESFRGSTYNSLHLSEFAFYDNISKTMASIFQTATSNALVILETTPNGHNEAKKLWEEQNAYEKVFISWMDNEKYKSKVKPAEKFDFIEEFLNNLKLTEQQRNWVYETYATKSAGDFNIFKQEFASDPITCFISSGENYFTINFAVDEITTGYLEFFDKHKYSPYVMGVDTAGGSKNGDYSSFIVLDVADPNRVKIAASFYDRISPSEFGELVYLAAVKYNALIVCENNSYGLSIIETLEKKEYPYIYRKVSLDKLTNKFEQKLGFHTSAQTRPFLLAKLQKWVNEKKIEITDCRLQKEINTFIYTDKGKPEASGKNHDDIIFATALALQGLDQVNDEIAPEVVQQRPANIREVMELEMKTGSTWDKISEHLPENPIDEWQANKQVFCVDDVYYLPE